MPKVREPGPLFPGLTPTMAVKHAQDKVARSVTPRDAKRPWEIRNAAAETAELFLYDEIGGWGVYATDFVQDLARISAGEIVVRLNSPGGDVWDGIAIANALREHPATVTVKVDALAASIASVIALAGDRVVMGRSAQMMIHNASTMAWGDAADLRQTADLLEKISGVIAQAYADRAGTPVEEWQALMDAETWFTADECVARGLADEVAALPSRETGVDPDPESAAKPAVPAALLRPAARLDTTDPATVVPVVPVTASVDGPAGEPPPAVEDAAADPVEDDPADGPADGPTPEEVAVLGQALSWWLAIDQVADRALAQIAARLGVPNPDDDGPEPPALPNGAAGLAAVLGMLTSVDTIVDGGQAILARALGIPNPDEDDPDNDDDEPAMSAATTDPPPAAVTGQAIDTPGTGATASTESAEWADITSHLTTTPADLADVFADLEGAWL